MRRVRVIDLVTEGLLRVEDGNHGNDRPRPDEFETSGVAFIRAADMTSGVVNFSTAGRINATARKRIRKGVGAPGDVILSHKGTVGKVAVAPEDSPEFVCSPQTTFWRSLDDSVISQSYLRYVLVSPDFTRQLDLLKGQTDMAPYVSLTDQRSMVLNIPSISEQQAIAEVLGALDDKIAANTKLADTSASLAAAMFTEAVRTSSSESVLSDITSLLSRGITPKYSEEDDTMMVLNQKCVRGQRVELDPARRTLLSKVREDKILHTNDVLVNSTGQGTLGRVSRWTSTNQATVDSHITIVRFDASCANPVTAGIGLLGLQDTIVEMGEGSTGQTELSRVELGKLRLKLPTLEVQSTLGRKFSSMSEMERTLFDENLTLAATRDALLPQLMSGKLRVKDVETVLENAGV